MQNTHNILRNLFESTSFKNNDLSKKFSGIKGFIGRQNDEKDTPIEPKQTTWKTLTYSDYKAIVKLYKIDEYENLLYFLKETLELSNKNSHHPQIVINNKSVEIKLFSHDVNDVTDIDIQMAREIDEIYEDISFVESLRWVFL